MKWTMALLTFLMAFSIAASPAGAARSEVRVAEKSTVRVGDPIRLGTLLAQSPEDTELDGRIHDLVVFEAMGSEEERVFQSEELALILRQKMTFQDLKRLALKIPERFTIRAQRNYLYAADIKREILLEAQSLCSGCSVELDSLNIPEIKSREEILQTQLEAHALKKAGGVLVPLTVQTSQGKHVYWVTGKISFYKMAPVAKRLIRSNEPLAQSDFELKRVDVSFAKDGLAQAEDLAGKVAARPLAVGQTIFFSDLKKEIAAQKGQMVKILIGGDSFEVTSSGVAEDGGTIGDVIRVKSSETQKLLSGVLVDKATIRVQ